MPKDNIIKFPSTKGSKNEELFEEEELLADDYASMFAETIMDTIHESFHEYDVCINEDENLVPIMMFASEALRALYLKVRTESHPLHDVAESLYSKLANDS